MTDCHSDASKHSKNHSESNSTFNEDQIINDFHTSVPSSSTKPQKQNLKILAKKGVAKRELKASQKVAKISKIQDRQFRKSDRSLLLIKALDKIRFEDWKTSICLTKSHLLADVNYSFQKRSNES